MGAEEERGLNVNRGRSALALGLLSCLLLGQGGCGLFGGGEKTGAAAGIPVTDDTVTLTLLGTDRLNSCGNDQGNALAIRIYQLSGNATITGLALTQLWDRESEELKADLIDHTEVILEPEGQLSLKVERRAGALFLAVAGNFCRAEEECWIWLRPLDDGDIKQTLTFEEFCIREAREPGR